jgi:hypothetical protein
MTYVEELEKRCEELQDKLTETACFYSFFTIKILESHKQKKYSVLLKFMETEKELFKMFNTRLDDKDVWLIEYSNDMRLQMKVQDEYFEGKSKMLDVVRTCLQKISMGNVKVTHEITLERKEDPVFL